MNENEIIIKVTLTGDGKVKLDQLTTAINKATEATKRQTKAQQNVIKAAKGSERYYLEQIAALKKLRATNANNAKSYAEVGVQISKLEAKLQKLRSTQQEAIQTNADQISSAGLAGATLNEFGRFVSDLPFGITAVTNNLSQLANLFTILAAKVNGGRKAFALLLKELKGPLGIIIAFQVAIALLQGFQDQLLKLIGVTDEARERQKEFAKTLNESLGNIEGERVKLLSLINVLRENTASREAQLNALNKIKEIYPELTEANKNNADQLDLATEAVNKYTEAQQLRAEMDALVATNADLFSISAQARAINEEDDLEKKEKMIKDFVKRNADFGQKFQAALYGKDRKTVFGVIGAMFGYTTPSENKRIFEEISTQTSMLIGNVTEQLNTLSGLLDGDDTSDNGKRKKVSAALSRQIRSLKDVMSKTTTEIDEEEKKNRQKAINRVRALIGLPPLEGDAALNKLLQEAQEAAKLGLDIFTDTLLQQNDFEKKLHDERMNRLSEENQKRQEIAANIIQAVSRLSQIQNQAFTAQIKRLDTERDVILNNDNLTAEEKDRLLKKNDAETRKVRTRQVKFERDMMQIEMAMELAKIALQIKSKIIDLEATGALSVAKGQSSLGAFVNQLGAAGIIAYAASIGGIIATIISARKKARQEIQALSNQSVAVGGGTGAASGISSPAFNVVGATQTSQLAQTIAGAEDKPLRAYVVASDVSTAQELERSTIEGASIG